MHACAITAPIRYCCIAGKNSVNVTWFTNANAVRIATMKSATIDRKPNIMPFIEINYREPLDSSGSIFLRDLLALLRPSIDFWHLRPEV